MPHLPACIGSVRGQDAGIDRIHLVQDGGSTDGSRDWLTRADGVAAVMEKDAGMYDAINRAWSRADADVYSWLNSDEQYLPGTLAAVRDAFTRNPDIDIVFGDAIIVDPSGNPLAARREIPLRAWYVTNTFLYALSCTIFFRGRLRTAGDLAFDTTYRVAGDLELILRLLRRGARCLHLPRYLSLFGVDGRNLSLSEGMAREGEVIQRAFGAYRTKPLRRAVHALRCLERAARGCYATDTVSYAFALDATPTYRTLDRVPLGFRFTYDRALRTLKGSTP